SLNDIGKVYAKKGNYATAREYHERAISFAKKFDLQLDIAQSYLGLGNAWYKEGLYNEALTAYLNAQSTSQYVNLKKELKEAYQGLAVNYAALKDFKNAYRYQALYTNIKDTLFNSDIAEKINNLQTDFDIQKKQGQIDSLEKDRSLQKTELGRQKFVRNTLLGILVFALLITFILFSLYRKVGRRTAQLRRSLKDLKSTQAQLIQSEKMASLGELTAGIAHEIQNPLNFVNNFSELNKELIVELKDAIGKENLEEVEALAGDIALNEDKINFHGKRAAAIIKGMLQHSRASASQKELTDINALCDEYLRLVYHGLRAKDKTFNAAMQMNFDKNIGSISIVPQDIGRVLLNLFTNAFYSVTVKKNNPGPRRSLHPPTGGEEALQGNEEEYQPTVSVSTKKFVDSIEIIVKDNGTGIPQNVLDKIFQPFFTTKPSGHGTGLGLSLSYDVIKSHAGKLKVETKDGEGATFIIQLPLQ
ncbi:MAG: ATP-binding protein, partial [Ferruginibacter sp.]